MFVVQGTQDPELHIGDVVKAVWHSVLDVHTVQLPEARQIGVVENASWHCKFVVQAMQDPELHRGKAVKAVWHSVLDVHAVHAPVPKQIGFEESAALHSEFVVQATHSPVPRHIGLMGYTV